MSSNTFGLFYTFTSFGESHGAGIGVVLDGLPAGIALEESHIQPALDRRRPGHRRLSSTRRESDRCRILSGTAGGYTTGAPVAVFVENEQARPEDYKDVGQFFRPNHADYAWDARYGGFAEYRGGGRSSGRETIARVIAGAAARRLWEDIEGPDLRIYSYLQAVGPHGDTARNRRFETVEDNPLFAADPAVVELWSDYIAAVRKAGDSVGGVVEARIVGLRAGFGEPIYRKLDALIAGGLMSIGAVKGVEIGDGFRLGTDRGAKVADQMRPAGTEAPLFLSNHMGGIAGGISTGQEVTVRAAFKPTPSIATPLETVSRAVPRTAHKAFVTRGRHDPCVAVRGVVVVEAMLWCVLADLLLARRASAPKPSRGGGE